MRRAFAVLIACGCGGRGWQPVVVNEAPPDPAARSLAFSFDDGQNGTELVVAILAHAKKLEVAAISGLEIQVGPCRREVSSRPRAVASTPSRDTELIVLHMREPVVSCRTRIVQEHTPPRRRELLEPRSMGDVQSTTSDECIQRPVSHVVLRYRYEVDHKFVPPDWQEIKRWTGAELAFGAPQCGLEPKNEIRARFHRDGNQVMPPVVLATPNRRAEVLALVARARASAEAGRAADGTRWAEQALASLAEDMDIDATLADAIAAAHFYVIEADVERFLAREPAEVDARWAEEVGSEIRRISQRYERMKELVRLPVVERWLKAGSARLAAMNAHLDALLAGAGYRRKG